MTVTEESAGRTVPSWTVGDRIRKARRGAGMTMDELADLIGIRRESVARWERDETAPNVSRLRHIEDVCEVRRGWLSTGRYTRFTSTATVVRGPWRPTWQGTRVDVRRAA